MPLGDPVDSAAVQIAHRSAESVVGQRSFAFTWLPSACSQLKSVAPIDVTRQEFFTAVPPSFALQLIGLCLVTKFPRTAVWLPEALR